MHCYECAWPVYVRLCRTDTFLIITGLCVGGGGVVTQMYPVCVCIYVFESQ